MSAERTYIHIYLNSNKIKIYHLFLSAPRLINIVCDLTSLIIMMPIMGHNQYLCALLKLGLRVSRIQQWERAYHTTGHRATQLHGASVQQNRGCSLLCWSMCTSRSVFPVVKIPTARTSDLEQAGFQRHILYNQQEHWADTRRIYMNNNDGIDAW